MKKYEELKKFYIEHGHLKIPNNSKYTKLNNWCYQLRNGKNKLSAEKKDLLNEINFVWKPVDYRWKEGFELLLEYKKKYGHCHVKQQSVKHKKLSSWCNIQKMYNHNGLLDKSKVEQLNSVGFSWFESKNDLWERRYNQLVKFKNDYGHFVVPRKKNPKTNNIDYKSLSNWMSTQRYYYSIKKLSPIREKKLNDIGFIWSFRN